MDQIKGKSSLASPSHRHPGDARMGRIAVRAMYRGVRALSIGLGRKQSPLEWLQPDLEVANGLGFL